MREDFLNRKLEERKTANLFRQLKHGMGEVDFCSNDYLGIATSNLLDVLVKDGREKNYGSTGSRLISGNYALIEEVEKELSAFHAAETGLLFNSGYDANLGLLSSVPQRGDTVLYDQLSHASIRDGVRLSLAASHSFRHNDMEDLEKKLSLASGNVFVVTESVFSMDGDKAPLTEISLLCDNNHAMLIVDEAHATGVVGDRGEGLVQEQGLEKKCFARIHTFGKAVGCHGAIVLGSSVLREYLVNFSRPFIYTTALPAAAVAAIRSSYKQFPGMMMERKKLQSLVKLFRSGANGLNILESDTPIQAVMIEGNEAVRKAAGRCQDNGFDVRPILYPTVPKGGERLRIVLHTFNSVEEIRELIRVL